MGLTKAQILERKNKKERIANVLRMPGWKDISSIFEEEFMSNLEKVTRANDPEARGALNALKRIGESISSEIEWGNVATNEYRKRYIGTISGGE